ncbi:glucosaminidase domain-containing protein [Sunxiuqinia dokdonensis]|uniref:Peptidoglycan hydrolase n=1 Tax=Sunxiuqinia dokdonensis TaxID=1409788 RepID=A0A0L8V720_9BACT|nr:glucosaminidase domain-containing protein [Sunxiuqinia dokdonensis]KOH44012.1 glycoside hydrolase [Sunxiuqinia dokdonensis]
MIRKTSLSIFFLIFVLVGFSQRINTREEYIKQYAELAVSEMIRSGVPASITLAQACLESGNGNSTLSRKSNNHFGIKCKSTWNGKRVYHDDDEKGECFRRYNSVEESFIDHSDFLMLNPRYASLFQLKLTDYKGWARGLKKAGYATNPHYANHLIRIIEDHKLYLYDEGLDQSQIARIQQSHKPADGRSLINPYQTRKVVMRNGLKSIVVKEGDTFQRIAQEFDMKEWEIYAYNDYEKGHQPRVNEILYVEPKRRKAEKNHQIHRFEADDTMHFLSQRYGVKLNRLYRLNRMKPGERPEPGTSIYLRKKKPRN